MDVRELNSKYASNGKLPSLREVITESGALRRIPEIVRRYGAKKVMLIADCNTWKAAGEETARILDTACIPYSKYVYPQPPRPDRIGLGDGLMHYDLSTDFLIGVGSGVINDICKILSTAHGCPYMIVGTAPSMDGYASETSSMARDGVKASLPVRGAEVILGDTEVLRNAPSHMLAAGLGDMLAKYISLAEWKISNIINGEEYNEEIADLVRVALKECVDNRKALASRDADAAAAVFDGLVIGGLGMSYAGCSRPASGCEHYISHLIDMRSLEFGTPEDLHGIQCGVATLYIARVYEKMLTVRPDREKALAHARRFDISEWNKTLRTLLGKAAEPMIELEKKEGKYDAAKHAARLETIIARWDGIVEVIKKEIPPASRIEEILLSVGAPTRLSQLGVDESFFPVFFRASKDMRDKYVLSRLAWDLGIEDELV